MGGMWVRGCSKVRESVGTKDNKVFLEREKCKDTALLENASV